MSRPTREHLLRVLSKCSASAHLKAVASLLVVHGVVARQLFLSRFVESCFHLCAPHLALSIIKGISKPPSLYLINLMVKGLSRYELFEDILSLYGTSYCQFNHFTVPTFLKACSALGAVCFGRKIHCKVLKIGVGNNVYVTAALVDHYAKLDFLVNAEKVVDEIAQPDIVCFNALIAGYSCHGFDYEALMVLMRIFDWGLMPDSSTLASAIPICARLGCLNIGRLLHGIGVKHNFFVDDFLVPALISLHTNSAFNVSSARKLFNSVLTKSVATWNSMIYAYTKTDMSSNAFEVFRNMLCQDVRPDFLTFVSLITSSGISCSPSLGYSLHAFVIKLGLSNHCFISKALITIYSQVADIDAAEFIFNWTPNKNTLVWNALVAGYICNELWTNSLCALNKMLVGGFSLDSTSIVNFLSTCLELGANTLGKAAHALATRMGFDTNIILLNALLTFYVEVSNFKSAVRLFQSMHTRSTVSWNIMISGYVHNGNDAQALELLKQMQREDAEFDIVTIINVLPIFCYRESLVQGRAVHGYAVKKGFESDVFLANSLISMYSDCGLIESSISHFEALPIKSTVSWNLLMTAYRNHGLPNQLLVHFQRMINEGIKLGAICLLNLMALVSNQWQGKSIHALAILTGSLRESTLLASLISMYSKFRNLKSCIELFEMGARTISVWNAVITAFVQNNMAEKAIHFFKDMRTTNMEADSATFLSIISACVNLNSIDLSDSLMAYLARKGCLNQTIISNAMMDLVARCGDLSTATEIFDNISVKDTVSWNSMIHGYALHGKADHAFATFWEMQMLRFRPNNYTYSSLLSVCSHAGEFERALVVFNSMVKHGIGPRIEHYECILDMLGRAGRFSDVFMVLKKLHFTPRSSVLGSVLGACRFYGNVEAGEKLGQMMFKSNLDNFELFLALSCIYSEAGRWEDAETVRSQLHGKQPGFSAIGGLEEVW